MATNHKPTAIGDAVTVIADGRDGFGDLLVNDSDSDGDQLQVKGVARGTVVGAVGAPLAGAYGALTVQAGGAYRYDVDESLDAVRKLADGATRTEAFRITVSDGRGGEASETLTVTVVGVNDAPAAADDARTIREDAVSVAGKVLTNDRDVDVGDTLRVTAVDLTADPGSAVAGRYGSLVLNVDGSYVYSIDNGLAEVQALGVGETVIDRFTYEIGDALGARSTATLVITIDGRNDPLVTMADAADATVGSPSTGNVLGNDADVDGDTLVVQAAGPKGGTVLAAGATVSGKYGSLVVQADGSYAYTVDGNNAKVAALKGSATLADSFTVQVSDGTVTRSSTLTLTVHAGSISPPPTLVDDDLDVVGDHATSGNLLANDANVTEITAVNGAPLASGVPVDGAYGSLAVSADGDFVYLPDIRSLHLLPGEHGQETFTYNARGPGGSAQATVHITVVGANDAPALNPFVSTEVVEDGPDGSGRAAFRDPDPGDVHTALFVADGPTPYGALYHSLEEPPGADADGTLSWSLVLTDNAQALGEGERFVQSYHAVLEDGGGNGVQQTLAITIVGRNDAPTFSEGVDLPTVKEWANGSPQELSDLMHVSEANFFFGDVDLSDVHTVSAVAHDPGYLGEFTVELVDQPNHLGLAHFEVADSAIDGLLDGEIVVQSYDVTVTDNHGGSVTRTVTVEIEGSSDAEAPEKAFFRAEEDVERVVPKSEGLFAYNPYATTLVDVTPLFGDAVPAGTPMDLSIGTLTFGADGSFVLEPNAEANTNRAGGEFDIDFTYSATGPDGPVSGTFNITLEGANDLPLVEDADATATVSADGASTADGLVTFGDPDGGDAHRTSFYPAQAGYLGEFSATVTDEPVDGAGGKVGWHFAIEPGVLALIPPGETRTQTYTIVIQDSAAASVEQQVTVTLEGPAAAQVSAHDDAVLTNAALGSAIAIPEWALVGNDISTAGPVTQIGAVRDASGGTLAGFTPTPATDDLVGFTLATAGGGGFSYDATAGGGTGSAHVAVSRTASGSGTAGADILVGSGGNDRLLGGDGNDIVIGGNGNDTLSGDLGDDHVSGGNGDDAITEWYGTRTIVDAGDGDDIVNILADGTMRGPIDGGAGRDVLSVSGSDITALDLSGIEVLQQNGVRTTGSVAQFESFATIWRAPGAEGAAISLLLADAGDFDLGGRETSVGPGGAILVRNATIQASDAGNTIRGGLGNDNLTGGAGADVLGGAAGLDSLTGRAGADAFVFAAPGQGSDTIIDFAHLADRIVVGAGGFGGGLGAGAAVHLDTGSAPVAMTSGTGWFLYDTDDGRLLWDDDGAGADAAIQIATLYGMPALSAADFVVRDDPFLT